MQNLSKQIIFISGWLMMTYSINGHAVGTPVGTQIMNEVTVNYNMGGSITTQTDSVSFFVQEIIDVNVGWQDAANILVLSSSADQVLTFLVTNVGNGAEEFSLDYDDSPVVTDEFDPADLVIFIDSNNNGIFDTGGVDVQHIPGTNDILLDANGVDSQIVFITGDIPAALNDGDEGIIELIANASTPGAAGATPGTVLTGLGDGGVDVLIGLTEASADTTGIYEVASLVDIDILKSADVIDDTGGGGSCTSPPCRPIPGAIIQYTLEVSALGGVDIAQDVVITDTVPANTTYDSSSITLDGSLLTDTDLDADEGFISANVVTVNLGDLNNSDTRTITFNVIIN